MRTIPLPNGSAVDFTMYYLLLKPRITTASKSLSSSLDDTEFLVNTHRPFALWELAPSVIKLPSGSKKPAPVHEETVAETKEAEWKVLGSWVVPWSDNGEGASSFLLGVLCELIAPSFTHRLNLIIDNPPFHSPAASSFHWNRRAMPTPSSSLYPKRKSTRSTLHESRSRPFLQASCCSSTGSARAASGCRVVGAIKSRVSHP